MCTETSQSKFSLIIRNDISSIDRLHLVREVVLLLSKVDFCPFFIKLKQYFIILEPFIFLFLAHTGRKWQKRFRAGGKLHLNTDIISANAVRKRASFRIR